MIKELAVKESIAASKAETVKKIGEIKVLTREFKELNVDRMVQTANEIIKKDKAIVTVFYGTDGKNARIMVMAGEKAIEKGVNASEIAEESAKILGGGGGGTINFAQGGGTITEKLSEAVKKAEETLKKQLGIVKD